MHKKLKTALKTLVAMGLGGLAGGAHAQYPVTDALATQAINAMNSALVNAVNATTSAVNTTSKAVSTAATAITGTMTSLTNTQILPAIKGSQSAITQMQKETSNVISQSVFNAATMPMIASDERRYRITNPCAVVSSAVGMSTTLNNAVLASVATPMGGRGGVGGTAHPGGGATADMNRALTIAEGGLPSPAPEISAVLAASGACGSFVGGGSQRGRDCSAAGFSASDPVGYQDADIKAATLFDGPQNKSAPQERLSIDMTPNSPEFTALSAFRRNLSMPLDLSALKPGELSSTAGRRYLGLRDAYEGRMSLAEYPVTRQMGMRTSTTANIPMLQQLMKPDGDPAFVGSYLAAHKPNWATTGISPDELMNLEVQRRYMNMAWLEESHNGTPEWKAGEQLRIAALQNVLLLRIEQELRVHGVLLGSLLGSRIRSESLPELKTAHDAAVR